MKRFASIAAAVAMPLIATAQTVNAPGGQAATALPPDVSAARSTSAVPKSRAPRHGSRSSRSASSDRNAKPNADAAVTKKSSDTDAGPRQPRGGAPDTPSTNGV